MKRSTPLFLSLSLIVAAFAVVPIKSAQSEDSIKIFWQKFNAAVRSGDKSAVASMTRFPLGMSYGIARIRNRAQLQRRYRQVFYEQTDAVKCFEKAQPEKDSRDPKQFTVACPDTAGNEVVIYHFRLTKAGWKFIALDNINE